MSKPFPSTIVVTVKTRLAGVVFLRNETTEATFAFSFKIVSISDAIDELSDNVTYGPQIHVPDSDLGDYPEDDRHYDGSGRVIDLDHVMVHGREGCDLPYPLKYHVEGEAVGIDPRHFANWQFN